jgi:NTP pyrophosphatase (non-canonical NTP hydrolase)
MSAKNNPHPFAQDNADTGDCADCGEGIGHKNHNTAEAEIAAEMSRAVAKFPTWPTDPLHALAVLGEEFGELTQAVLQQAYEPHKQAPDAVRKEAIQTAAMALRFVKSLDVYQFERCQQHKQ